MNAAYRYTAAQREEWTAELLAAAADRPGHRAYARALAAFWETAPAGDAHGEPAADDITGVTWKIECALSADFADIHSAALAPNVHSVGYTRQYIGIRNAARRGTVQANRTRNTAAYRLGGLLRTDSPDDDQ